MRKRERERERERDLVVRQNYKFCLFGGGGEGIHKQIGLEGGAH